MLRFPRHALGVARLAFEVRLLERIRPHLHIAVPEVVEVALDEPVGRAYVAHRYIRGRVVRREDVASWTPARIQRVGAEIGVFLGELHALASVAHDAGAARQTARSFAETLAKEFDQLLADHTYDEAKGRAARETAALAALPDNPTVLCHTDLGGNIVFDDDTGAVGVIDFGSCTITHPAFDLATLSVLGGDFVTACLTTHPELGRAVHHAGAVRGTFALQDALYGARQQEWAYVDEVLRGYAPSS